MINFLRSKIDFKASHSPHKTSNPDVGYVRLHARGFCFSDDLEEETGLVLDGRYTYIYTDPDIYDPLAKVRDWTTEDGKGVQQTHYFHCDQIDILREMTDKDGNLVWYGEYTA